MPAEVARGAGDDRRVEAEQETSQRRHDDALQERGFERHSALHRPGGRTAVPKSVLGETQCADGSVVVRLLQARKKANDHSDLRESKEYRRTGDA
jgi:hypothetical protein